LSLPYNKKVVNTTPMGYSREDFIVDNEDEEWITRCVVDPLKRVFYLYSNEGDEKVVDCDTVEQFMNVLEVIRAVMPEDIVHYANPF
jgi:hypothetical protein